MIPSLHLTFSGSTPQELQARFPNFQWSYGFDRLFSTRLPKNVVMIRAVAALVLTGLAVFLLKSYPRLRRFATVLGIVFAFKAVYTHLIAKDPLVEIFWKHLPTRNRSVETNHQQSLEGRLNQLPQLDLRQGTDESICSAIRRLRWEELDQPLYRAISLDGRNVFVLKGETTDPQQLERMDTAGGVRFDEKGQPRATDTPFPSSRLKVFVERFGPRDCIGLGRKFGNSSTAKNFARTDEWLHAVFSPLQGNTFSSRRTQHRFVNPACSVVSTANAETTFSGTISSAEAFEIFAQLDQRSTN
jgi:hypothetical protein